MSTPKNLRARVGACVAAGLLLVSLTAGAPAGAPEARSAGHDIRAGSDVRVYSYKVINKSTVSTSYINRAVLIGSCKPPVGGTCSVSRTVTVQRSVQVSLGASVSGVTAGLQLSGSSSVAVAIACNSARGTGSNTLYAYPVGTRYSYKVQKWEHVYNTSRIVSTSGTLYAFQPRNSEHCEMRG